MTFESFKIANNAPGLKKIQMDDMGATVPLIVKKLKSMAHRKLSQVWTKKPYLQTNSVKNISTIQLLMQFTTDTVSILVSDLLTNTLTDLGK